MPEKGTVRYGRVRSGFLRLLLRAAFQQIRICLTRPAATTDKRIYTASRPARHVSAWSATARQKRCLAALQNLAKS